jgi:hypothetical protein
MLKPSIKAVPVVGGNSPERMLKVVVFPAPLIPVAKPSRVEMASSDTTATA